VFQWDTAFFCADFPASIFNRPAAQPLDRATPCFRFKAPRF
jgi:hypothetical protein